MKIKRKKMVCLILYSHGNTNTCITKHKDEGIKLALIGVEVYNTIILYNYNYRSQNKFINNHLSNNHRCKRKSNLLIQMCNIEELNVN